MEVLFRAALRNDEWLDQLDDDDEEKREEAWDRFQQQLLTRSGLMGKWDMPFNWITGSQVPARPGCESCRRAPTGRSSAWVIAS
jgi:hypothetical protein